MLRQWMETVGVSLQRFFQLRPVEPSDLSNLSVLKEVAFPHKFLVNSLLKLSVLSLILLQSVINPHSLIEVPCVK